MGRRAACESSDDPTWFGSREQVVEAVRKFLEPSFSEWVRRSALPAMPGQKHAAPLERPLQCKRLFVSFGEREPLRRSSRKTAEEAGKVDGDVVDAGGRGVDQCGRLARPQQDVPVPHIAPDRLQWKPSGGPAGQFTSNVKEPNIPRSPLEEAKSLADHR